jgi:hypothetical protein
MVTERITFMILFVVECACAATPSTVFRIDASLGTQASNEQKTTIESKVFPFLQIFVVAGFL